MKNLVLLFLIIGKISFGQNCGFINSYETIPYLPEYESEYNLMKCKLQHFDDSMSLIRNDLYSRIVRFDCAVGLVDTARINEHREKNKKLLEEFKNFNDCYLESLRSLYKNLRMIVLTNLLNAVAFEIAEFAKIVHVDCMADSNYIYFCDNQIDFTEDFIDYLLRKYEVAN